jgi:hypothetical protein
MYIIQLLNGRKHSLQAMKIAPNKAINLFKSILLAQPKEGVSELEEIIQEVYELIRTEYPSLDLSEVIDKSLSLRPKIIKHTVFIQLGALI